MAPPDTAKAAPALSGNGLRKMDRLGGTTSPTTTTALAELQAARARLGQLDDALDTIILWKRSLAWRIAKTQLVFECADVDVDMDDLFDEVHQFRRVCESLFGREGAAG